ncbi:MAG TPA: hypothetical protein VGS58_11315 [Candidatus Sulfopaludibacter sp.]|nr:hypothetical protein [Candidatus Sulfopaludibacter sp.]
MNAVDAVALALLALADISLVLYLRRRRARKARAKTRVNRSLALAVRRELALGAPDCRRISARQRLGFDALASPLHRVMPATAAPRRTAGAPPRAGSSAPPSLLHHFVE